MAIPFIPILLWAVIGGTGAVVADSTLNEGKIRVAAGKVFGKDWSMETIKNEVVNGIDNKTADVVYNQVVKPMGVERSSFDEWWNMLNPTGNTGIFASFMAVDKALEQVGIDIIDAKTALILTVGYHFLITQGYGKKFLDYCSQTFGIDIGSIRPPGETPPRQDPLGFGAAADRKPAEQAPSKPEPKPQPILEAPEPVN